MPLYLFEVTPERAERAAVTAVLARIGELAASVGGELIESQVAAGHERLFVIVEAERAGAEALRGQFPGSDARGPDEVRLVGADLAELKAARPKAGYLVEWDLPAELDMDTYLARKKAKAPLYADVPEASFLRTYVREDMAKCLCLYDAPDEDVVRAARKAVDTPIDRLHALEGPGR
ncbi:DUF4242 domain-containing protein [Amycolatopsis taiwanensis]|uniref:DUF4242 domain-containing protein n=1 Tax=Amycolatopsis taiwanensis TaxID=342230 RepID=A0A9W6R855_9PSEU|nr:DUF4242 domain-containing protein [Amycolatopsis taiwanensis]GLY71126.1 hypothetical protein Atai01_77450 [Amycolatopsis taiwanensis]